MSANYGAIMPLPIFASSTVIAPLSLTTAADTVLFEAYWGIPIEVIALGAHVCVATTASDPATISFSRRVVGGLEGTEYPIATVTILGGAIAGSVWLNEQRSSSISTGIINPYLNYGESLVVKVTGASAAGSFLPIFNVCPFRSGTAATSASTDTTGVAKKVISTNAVGTIFHVVA